MISPEDPLALANRAIRYASDGAGTTAGALLEVFTKPRSRRDTIDYWLVDMDFGYGAGLMAAVGSAAALVFQLWWLAIPLLLVAFALCWWFA